MGGLRDQIRRDRQVDDIHVEGEAEPQALGRLSGEEPCGSWDRVFAQLVLGVWVRETLVGTQTGNDE